MHSITVIGAGYVGLTTATMLVESGYRVFLIDIDARRLNIIRSGRAFFYEEGLDSLVAHALRSGNLLPTDSYKESIPNSQVVMSCVGTPDNPDGSTNLEYIFSSARESLKYMKPGTVYIQKSTVPVGTGSRIEKLFKDKGKKISYVSNPEFLRESTAVLDSLYPDRTVVGSHNRAAAGKVLDLFKNIERKRVSIAKTAGLNIPASTPLNHYIKTGLNSAELIKVTSNAFLALKISFANSIAQLADTAGADVKEIMDVVGIDPRIGRSFLNAGRGYGGGCFPKDVAGLIASAKQHKTHTGIMEAAQEVNDQMVGYIINKAKSTAAKTRFHKTAVLGLAFKAGTSDARRSPGVKMANLLTKMSKEVSVYDPKAHDEAAHELNPHISVCLSMAEAVKGADVVFVATDWPEFTDMNLKHLVKTMSGTLLVDCMNVFDKNKVESAGLKYTGVGR